MKYLILPVTEARKCPYVELVANDKQEPTWLVSHWWGEPFNDFIKYLKEHAEDYGLNKNTTYYWICAYANNQWNLELGESLEESPFYKAMEKSKGTISILDSNGVVFNRIWCVYELYVSLLNRSKDYTWCVYTSTPSVSVSFDRVVEAIGLTEGNNPFDETEQFNGIVPIGQKYTRERNFPKQLLEKALTINVSEAEASEEDDKVKILAKIGSDADDLNSSLKGRFAEAGLRLMLESGSKKMWAG